MFSSDYLSIITTISLVIVGLAFNPMPLNGQEKDDQQRIVFLGDSITQSGDRPGGYVSKVREAFKKTSDSVEVIGAGISGNKVPDLQKRLKRDVLDRRPTTVVIYIGINDVWHSQRGDGTPVDKFESGLNDIIDQIQEVGARVILCTPSTIGEKHDDSNSLDKMLTDFSAVSRKVAESQEVELLDLRKEFIDYLKENNPENRDRGILTNDGVHLNPAGNQFVAEKMLSAINGESERVLRHIVLFKFVEGLEQEKVDEVVEKFADLENQVDSIVDFESGTNVSPEQLDQGYTHCFVVTFADEAGRDAYLPHPAHKAFVEFIGGKIDQVLVVDYWAN